MVLNTCPSFSIVIETDNLAIVDLRELFRCLDSIASQGDILKLADGVFVADGGIVPESVLVELQRRYPWITIVHAANGTSYINLKLAGASETGSELIVFCDGDISYEAGWLEALLDGFRKRPDADLIAGETTTPITGPYSLAFAITFNFPRLTGESALAPSTTYWANNLAARRETLVRVPLPDPSELYRGQNLVHTARMLRHAAVILRQPMARGWHAVIAPSEIIQRYYMLGKDAASVRAITRLEGGSPHLGAMAPDKPGHGVVGRIVGRLQQIARTQPKALIYLPLSIPVLCVMGLAYMTGRMRMARHWKYGRSASNAVVT
ncbi:MAG: glycosyltransferase [Cyanobacteriota bacterium]|nr:glycosyltransferase [Cyanobacteriota bacterium]